MLKLLLVDADKPEISAVAILLLIIKFPVVLSTFSAPFTVNGTTVSSSTFCVDNNKLKVLLLGISY